MARRLRGIRKEEKNFRKESNFESFVCESSLNYYWKTPAVLLKALQGPARPYFYLMAFHQYSVRTRLLIRKGFSADMQSPGGIVLTSDGLHENLITRHYSCAKQCLNEKGDYPSGTFPGLTN